MHGAVRVAPERDAGTTREEHDPARHRRDEGDEQREEQQQGGTGEQCTTHRTDAADHRQGEDLEAAHQLEVAGGDRRQLHRVQRAAEPGDAGGDREHRELGAEQVHAERRARRFAVLHREQAPAQPTAPDRDDDQRDERERDGDEHHLRRRIVELLAEEVEGVDRHRPVPEEVHLEQAEHLEARQREHPAVQGHRERGRTEREVDAGEAQGGERDRVHRRPPRSVRPTPGRADRPRRPCGP